MELVKHKINLQQRHVAMLVYSDFLTIDAIGPIEVFTFANLALQLMGKISMTEAVYNLSIVAEQRGPIKASNGISIVVGKSYEDLEAVWLKFIRILQA
jgi:transcriptional regulator GlxA family with amidase domain